MKINIINKKLFFETLISANFFEDDNKDIHLYIVLGTYTVRFVCSPMNKQAKL